MNFRKLLDMKKSSLFGTRHKDNIDESIGLRAGESSVPSYAVHDDPPPTNYRMDRTVGDIDITEVFPDPDQPRKEFDEQGLLRFGEEIREHGQLQAVGVRWHAGKWLLIFGERRYRAMKAAGLTQIKCRFYREPLSESQIREIQLTENLQRADLKPMDEARGYQGLIDLNGWSGKQVAEHLHISPAKVSRGLKLLKLDDDVQAKVESGELSAAIAYRAAKEKQPEARKKIIDDALAGKLTETKARKQTASKKRPTTTGKPRRSTNSTFQVDHGIRVVVSGRKFVGEQGVLDALLQAMEQQRGNVAGERKEAA